MSKKKKKKHQSGSAPARSGQSAAPRQVRPMPPAAIAGLRAANDLMARKQWEEALEALKKLEGRFPHHPEILVLLINTAYELGDIVTYAAACERLLVLTPDDPAILTMLGGAYMTLVQPARALGVFRRFLALWPTDSRAPETRQLVSDLELMLNEALARTGLSGEEGLITSALQEKSQSLMEQGDFRGVRKVCEEVLRRHPGYAPALNNLSLAHFMEGNLLEAIELGERVIAADPGNIHALANLVQFNWLSGHFDEARARGEQLKQSGERAIDRSTKMATAFTYLDDNHAILECLRAAESETMTEGPAPLSLLYHLGAVAAMRLGDEKRARQLWNKTLRVDPEFDLARNNLADLEKPLNERNGPWPFDMLGWLPFVSGRSVAGGLQDVLSHINLRDPGAVQRSVLKYLERRPIFVRMMPQMLQRGDPETREFIMKTIEAAEFPEGLAILRDFAQGQTGSDEQRLEAARIVISARSNQSGERLRIWTNGEWRDAEFTTQTIHNDPMDEVSPALQKKLERARETLSRSGPAAAEPEFRAIIAEAPDWPVAKYNLAACYLLQGRAREGRELLLKVHQEHPDYLMARAVLAFYYAADDDLDAAEEMLEPVRHSPRLRLTEFRARAIAEAEIALAEEKADLTEHWITQLAEFLPDDPAVPDLQSRLAKMPGARAARSASNTS